MGVTIQKLMSWKQQGRRIVALTAWDFLWADLIDKAEIDLVLVGDSLAMVALGMETTLPLTVEEIIHHAKAVRRGVKNALLVVDLPFLSYQESPQVAIANAGRILKETGANGVKLEGGYEEMVETVRRLVLAGIPVMSHLGLTPQSVHQLGYRQQGKTKEAGERILAEALALQKVGAFALILEHIPAELASEITEKLSIPTIGIGAGSFCDGQILVTADLLGLSHRQPPFVKLYAHLQESVTAAFAQYVQEVRSGLFPKS